MNALLLAFFWASLPYFAVADASKPIILNTTSLPPFHYEKDGRVVGSVTSVIECALKKLNQPYQIRVLPWLRAQKEVEQGIADGFYASRITPDRDAFAKPSDPVVYRMWYWYVRKDIDLPPSDDRFKKTILVGSLSGTQDADELKADGYRVVTVGSSKQIIQMLRAKRIGATRMVDVMIDEDMRELGGSKDEFKSYFRGAFPNSCYFGKKFLERDPGFFDRFNSKLGECFNPKK